MLWYPVFLFSLHCHWVDEKDFDVFLSYVWSPLSGDQVGGLPLFPPSGSDTDEEGMKVFLQPSFICMYHCTGKITLTKNNNWFSASPSGMDLLKTEEGYAIQRPLEVLLPRVLEDRWSYRLCLLERDLLPEGGQKRRGERERGEKLTTFDYPSCLCVPLCVTAYTDDVVHALQRSRMLICLLSADYLSNSNTVFVLESGIQVEYESCHLCNLSKVISQWRLKCGCQTRGCTTTTKRFVVLYIWTQLTELTQGGFSVYFIIVNWLITYSMLLQINLF